MHRVLLLQPKLQPASWPAQPASAPSATLAGSAGCLRVPGCAPPANPKTHSNWALSKTRIFWFCRIQCVCAVVVLSQVYVRIHPANMTLPACYLNAAIAWWVCITCGHFQTERREAQILSTNFAQFSCQVPWAEWAPWCIVPHQTNVKNFSK
jgi:hypothetical protein